MDTIMDNLHPSPHPQISFNVTYKATMGNEYRLNCFQMGSRILGESTIETRHWQLLSSRQEEKAGTMNFSEKGSPSVSEFKD
jgi:hypothetical protein